MSNIKQSIFAGVAIVAAAAVASCASAPREQTRRTANQGTDCIFGGTVSSWEALDDEHLILFASGRRPYLVELTRRAFGLSRDFRIGIYDRDGRICAFGGDAIIIDGIMPERITIRSIRRLDDDQLQRVYVDYGIEEPADVAITPIEIDEDEFDEEAED